MLKRYRVRDYDFKLIILLAAVTVIGIFSIGSAKVDVQNKQILGFVMGFFIMIVLSFFDYSSCAISFLINSIISGEQLTLSDISRILSLSFAI